MYDYIVVGAGLSGSIVARKLAENGKKVLVLEKRNHIAGNVYDYVNGDGILVQQYGPHIFHTNNSMVWDYVNQYGEWKDFFLECMVYMNGKFTPSPFNFQTIDDYFSKEEAVEIKNHIKSVYGDAQKATIVDMLESEDTVVKNYAQFLFDNDYSLYTAKQWGIKPSEIDISVLKRVPVLFSYKTGYFDDRYQAMPSAGFSDVVRNILNHDNITVELNVNAKDKISIDFEKKVMLYNDCPIPVIWTGALDDLFDYKYGKLPYRSLRFEWKTFNKESFQSAPVVAYPQEKGFTRISEYKKLPNQDVVGKTSVAYEYPLPVTDDSIVEPYYPIPNDSNQKMYLLYREEANEINGLFLCGRLAEYRYYNMDQIILNALELTKSFEE